MFLAYTMDHVAQGNNIVIFRSARSQLISILCLIALIAYAVYATHRYDWAVQDITFGSPDGRQIHFPLPLFGLLPLALAAKILHSLLNFRYILCDTYVLEVQGLWALRRKSIRLNYVHIRGVEISESIVQQLLGIGDIEILSDISIVGASGIAAEHTILMRGVARPREIKDTIQSHIQSQSHLAKAGLGDA